MSRVSCKISQGHILSYGPSRKTQRSFGSPRMVGF